MYVLTELLVEPTSEDFGVCQGPSALGWLAKPTLLGKSCQLVEWIKELWGLMEPFTTITKAQMFDPVEPSDLVQINPFKSRETIESSTPQECRSGRNCGTRTRSVGPTRGIGCLKVTVPSTANASAGSSQKTGVLNIFTQWVKTPLGSLSMQIFIMYGKEN